jgi:hypothetical protein
MNGVKVNEELGSLCDVFILRRELRPLLNAVVRVRQHAVINRVCGYPDRDWPVGVSLHRGSR